MIHRLPRASTLLTGLLLATLLLAACGDDKDAAAETGVKVGPLALTSAYAHPAPVGDNGAVYVTVKNTGDADDALTGAESAIAGNASLHQTVSHGATETMEPVERLTIPAKGSLAIAPGVYHIMLENLTQPLTEGELIPVTLTFERAGPVTLQVPVIPYTDTMDSGAGHAGH